MQQEQLLRSGLALSSADLQLTFDNQTRCSHAASLSSVHPRSTAWVELQFCLLLTWKLMQALCKDARMLPAGGAPEIELCQQLHKFGRKETGLDQYAIAKFAESLEVGACRLSLNAHITVSPCVRCAEALQSMPGLLKVHCCHQWQALCTL